MDMLATRGTTPRGDSPLGARGVIEREPHRWSALPAAATALDACEDGSPAAESDTRFERLIADASGRLGDVSPDDVGTTLAATLRTCTDALGMDRGTILLMTASEPLTVRYDAPRPELPALPAGTPATALFPALAAAARIGDLFSYARVEAVPDASDRERLRRLGTKSGLTIPLRHRGVVVGALCFTMHRHERRWSPEVVERARLVAAIVAGAIALERADAEHRKTQSEMHRLRARLDESVGVM